MGRLAKWMGQGRGRRTGLIVVICVAAWFIGTESGHLYGVIKQKLTAKSRTELTADLLAAMKTIEVGGHLGDHSFQDMEGKSEYLSTHVTGPTLLAVISLSCDGCLKEMEILSDPVLRSQISQRLIIVSSGNPVRLKQLADSLQFGGIVLWDEDRAFQSNLHIESYPFNLFLDSGLIVNNVIVGGLKPEDFAAIK